MNEEREGGTQGTGTPGYEPQTPPKTSGLAIASLVLAIVGLCTVVTLPIALILGIIALVQMGKNPQLRGQGMAIAGMVVCGFGIFTGAMMAAIMFPVFARAREAAQRTACLNNVKQLSMSLQMYAADYNEHFPSSDNWNGTLRPYFKNPRVLVCPSVKSKGPSYGMNDRIAGIATRDVISPGKVVSFFDSAPGINQSGGQELLPVPPRHLGGNNVSFADGHASYIEIGHKLTWDPAAASGAVTPPAASEESKPAPSGT